MDSDRGEVALAKELVELCSSNGTFNEDDDLVELHFIEKFIQLTVLLLLIELDVILLKTMESEFCLIVDEDLMRILHKLGANRSDLWGKSCTEEHNLLLRRSSTENLLHVAAHV